MLFEKSGLEKYVIGKGLIEDDGHIHIRAHYTVLFDHVTFTPAKGFNGTPIMIYVVNTAVERIGNDKVKIEHNGEILESYPMQFSKIYKMEHIDASGIGTSIIVD